MPKRHAESFILIVLVVSVSLLSAGTSLKTVALSLTIFAVCLSVFFFPSIQDFFKRRKQRNSDRGL